MDVASSTISYLFGSLHRFLFMKNSRCKAERRIKLMVVILDDQFITLEWAIILIWIGGIFHMMWKYRLSTKKKKNEITTYTFDGIIINCLHVIEWALYNDWLFLSTKHWFSYNHGRQNKSDVIYTMIHNIVAWRIEWKLSIRIQFILKKIFSIMRFYFYIDCRMCVKYTQFQLLFICRDVRERVFVNFIFIRWSIWFN